MRSSLRAIVVAAALLLPSAASADLLVTLREPSMAFGPGFADFGEAMVPGFTNISIDGIDAETPFSFFSGDVTFVTGAAESVEVFDGDPDRVSSEYIFGPGGTFTLTAHWIDKFGNPAQGQYVAPVLSLHIDVRCEQELSTVNCGDSGGGHHSLGDMIVFFGPGEFDANLARVLHVHRKGGAFDFDLPLDGIEGNPTDDFRPAGSNFGMKDIVIPTAVPEPSILSLLLLAPVLSRRFRR